MVTDIHLICSLLVASAAASVIGCLHSSPSADLSVLGETGTIYFIEERQDKPRSGGQIGLVTELDCVDCISGARARCSVGGQLRTNGWSIEADLICGCIDGQWEVRSLASKQLVCSILGDYVFAALSPNLDKVALLERGPQVWAIDPSRSDTAYELGARCRLKVFHIPSGDLVAECPVYALNFGVCWAGEGWNVVCFSSFTNATYFDTSGDTPPEGRSTTYYLGPASLFPVHLHFFHPDDGSVSALCEGMAPQKTNCGSVLTYYDRKRMRRLDLASDSKRGEVLHTASRACAHVVSPSGKFVLTAIAPRFEWEHDYRLVVADRRDGRATLDVAAAVEGVYAWSKSRLPQFSALDGICASPKNQPEQPIDGGAD